MKKHENYIERDDLKGATHLEVSVYYTKGGLSYFSNVTTPRGYYVSVRPVTKHDSGVSFDLFAGRRQLLFETARYNDKQFDRAVKMAANFENQLIAAVVEENKAA
jgi:hypothetical protein